MEVLKVDEWIKNRRIQFEYTESSPTCAIRIKDGKLFHLGGPTKDGYIIRFERDQIRVRILPRGKSTLADTIFLEINDL